MKRLTLHIGSHKTGTSTLQATFRENEAALLSRGLAVAYVPPWDHVHPLLDFVNPREIFPGGYRVTGPLEFAEFLARPPADHVFASSENFSFFFQQDTINDLATALKARFGEIRIVVYLRRQDRHAVSHHQEGAKANRPPEGLLWGHSLTALPDPAPLQRLYLDYNQRIAMWESAFGSANLSVRVFDRALLDKGDIVSDMLALIGVDGHGIVRSPDVNISLSRMQAKVGHIANALIGDDSVTQRLLDAVYVPDGDRMAPSAAAARAFLEPYRESNRLLNARLGITSFPDLFPDDFSDYPETASEDMPPGESIAALQAAIRTLGGQKMALQDVTADELRLSARSLAKSEPWLALRLARAALSLRPNGPAILQLVAELEARIG
jgi:hypothetical protein